MKNYKKEYEDIYSKNPKTVKSEKISSTFGTSEELAEKFRKFYSKAYIDFFDMVVRQVWLEQHFVYDGKRRNRRNSNGFSIDRAFGHFILFNVGYNHKVITSSLMFTALSTYLKDFFPNFLDNDPFENPELYKFPFKYVTLDHMIFVYQMPDVRMEMLQYAEDKMMTPTDFANWATNYIFCANDEAGKDIYNISTGRYFWPHVNNSSLVNGWRHELFNFK